MRESCLDGASRLWSCTGVGVGVVEVVWCWVDGVIGVGFMVWYDSGGG